MFKYVLARRTVPVNKQFIEKMKIRKKKRKIERAQLKGTDGVQPEEKCAFHETKLTHYIHFFCLIYCCFTWGPNENSIHRRRWHALSPIPFHTIKGIEYFRYLFMVCFTPYRFLLLSTPTLFIIFFSLHVTFCSRNKENVSNHSACRGKKCFALVFYEYSNTFSTNYNIFVVVCFSPS